MPLLKSIALGFLWSTNHKMMNMAVNGRTTERNVGKRFIVITVNDEYGTIQSVGSWYYTSAPIDARREGSDSDGRHYMITAVI